VAWKDLASRPDAAAAAIHRRMQDDRSPARAQLFPWPKDSGSSRPMVWLDPLDQALYHAVVGRFVAPVESRIDRRRVLSARPVRARRSWALEPFSIAIGERRTRALGLLNSQPHGTLGLLDVRDYYPSVSVALLTSALGDLPLADMSLEYLVGWLRRLHDHSDVKGLPIGPDGSSILGNVLLSGADDCIAALQHEFLRYMDDTWVFLEDVFGFTTVRAAYESYCRGLGLALNDEKTRPVTGMSRYDVVTNAAIDYFSEALSSGDEMGLAAARSLFEYAAEQPVERKTELRRSLTELTKHGDLVALHALQTPAGITPTGRASMDRLSARAPATQVGSTQDRSRLDC
jgi:hypothetical protein